MKYLIPAFSLFFMVACSKNENQIDSFIDCEKISEEYKPYNGEKIGCQFHFVLTNYNNKQYIELIAHCADLTRPVVINENCEDICEISPYDPNSECGKYLKNREVGDILFIKN